MKNTQLASSLRTVTSRLFKRLRQEINTVDKLSLTEVSTLSNLYHYEPLAPSTMAEMVMIKAQSMSQIITRLEDFGLITKTPSESDKRKVAISLSQQGRLMVEKTRNERDQWLNSAINERLNPEEKKILAQAVVLMEKLVEHQ